jgi:hypothetical protein
MTRATVVFELLLIRPNYFHTIVLTLVHHLKCMFRLVLRSRKLRLTTVGDPPR